MFVGFYRHQPHELRPIDFSALQWCNLCSCTWKRTKTTRKLSKTNRISANIHDNDKNTRATIAAMFSFYDVSEYLAIKWWKNHNGQQNTASKREFPICLFVWLCVCHCVLRELNGKTGELMDESDGSCAGLAFCPIWICHRCQLESH